MVKRPHSLMRRPSERITPDLALAFLGARSAQDVRMRHVVAEHIARVLDATNGNLSLTAQLLGVNRRTMQRYARRRRRAR
jgi:ActR/RegA family two-component response regulator